MWNSSKPFKFSHLCKLANQSRLNKAYVIEITKACKVFFSVKTRDSYVVCIERNVSVEKKGDGEDSFFKASS